MQTPIKIEAKTIWTLLDTGKPTTSDVYKVLHAYKMEYYPTPKRPRGQPKPVRTKYNSVKIYVNDVKFDSEWEASRAVLLLLWERNQIISDLTFHPSFSLTDAFRHHLWGRIKPTIFTPDFMYYRKDLQQYVVEDAKNPVNVKERAYVLRRKIWMLKYPDYFYYEIIKGKGIYDGKNYRAD